jgi:hypothetical protein
MLLIEASWPLLRQQAPPYCSATLLNEVEDQSAERAQNFSEQKSKNFDTASET